MQGFGEAKIRRSSSRFEDFVPTLEWPKDEYETIRLIGPIYSYCNIWFTIRTQKKPEQPIPKLCLDLDGETDEFTTDICPYRASGKGRPNKWYAVNCIVRSLQTDSRGKLLDFPTPRGMKITERHGYKAYWGTKEQAKYTPVRVVVFSENAAEKLVNMKKLNRVKTEDGTVSYEIGDAKFGCDIDIMIDSNKKGAAQVDIQKGDRTPITKEERSYVIFPLDLYKPERLEEAKREMADLMSKLVEKGKKGSSDRDRDDSRDSQRGGRGRSKADDVDPDEDDVAEFSEDDLDADADDVEMEDRPRNRKKSRDDDDDRGSRSRSRKSRDEDEDDLDADLSEDDGEDGDDDYDDEESDDEGGDEDGDDLDADLDDDDDRPRGRSGGRDDRGRSNGNRRPESRSSGRDSGSRDRGRDSGSRDRDRNSRDRDRRPSRR